MGKKSRTKGQRVEREAIALIRSFGGDAERVPLSGAAGGRYADDIVIYLDAGDFRGEVKARKDGQGFARLYDWMESAPCGMFALNEDLTVLDQDAFQILVNPDETAYQEIAIEIADGLKPHHAPMKTLYRWMGETADFLAVKKDRAPFIFVMKNSMLQKVLGDDSDAP